MVAGLCDFFFKIDRHGYSIIRNSHGNNILCFFLGLAPQIYRDLLRIYGFFLAGIQGFLVTCRACGLGCRALFFVDTATTSSGCYPATRFVWYWMCQCDISITLPFLFFSVVFILFLFPFSFFFLLSCRFVWYRMRCSCELYRVAWVSHSGRHLSVIFRLTWVSQALRSHLSVTFRTLECHIVQCECHNMQLLGLCSVFMCVYSKWLKCHIQDTWVSHCSIELLGLCSVFMCVYLCVRSVWIVHCSSVSSVSSIWIFQCRNNSDAE